MKNPELACDWCGNEVPAGEGMAVDDDRVCPECAAIQRMVNAARRATDGEEVTV
jgi:formylmethanofuran dehydrogenase subunit E